MVSNWFAKFAQYINIDFNISTLEKLLQIPGEHAGQNYLFQDEELDQLKHLRGNLPLETKAKIQRLIELSHNLFLEIGQISFESYNSRQYNYVIPYLESPPYSDEQVIEQAKENAYNQVNYSEYNWEKEEFANFMLFLSNRSELDSLLNDLFEKVLTQVPDKHDAIYQEVKDKYQMFEQAGVNINPTFQEFEIAFQNRDPNTYYREFFQVLSELTEDMIVAVVDNNNEINPFASNKNKNITDNPYFPWINKKSLKIITESRYKDALSDWHFDQNEDYYLQLQPNSTQHNKNVQLLNRLQQQLTLAPEVPNQRTLQNKIRKLNETLSDLNTQLLNVDVDRKLYSDNKKNPSKYHAQKGPVEKAFKDWIPIFFNAAIREAKKRNFLHLKLISAKQLMNSWSGYGGKEKEALFKRIYDNTAQLHNGKPINEQGKEWWDIPLETARYANKSNWLKYFLKASF